MSGLKADKKDLLRLIDKIHVVEDQAALMTCLQNMRPETLSASTRVAFVNAHAFNLCHNNPDFLKTLLDCDFVFRDGAGMKILFHLMKKNPGLNMNGTDFIPKIMTASAGQNAALFGTQSPYLDRAAALAKDWGIEPVLVRHGYSPDQEYVESLRQKPVSLVILGMGMPKQEMVAAAIARALNHPCLIVCGGAILDFMGGKVSRAPGIVRQFGMEWAYRLMLEPRRLFNRYVIGNGVFLYRAYTLSQTRSGSST